MKHRRKKKGNVVLIGFMGSGKTSVGLRLSFKLRMAIEDTDKIIEQRQGRSVSDIFAQEGEEYFRALETSLLEELASSAHGRIISVGGGTPVRKENRELLKKTGTVVYLRIQPATVYERLKDDDTRPLLQGDNPLLRITKLMEQRQAVYEEAADITVDVDGLNIEEILDIIEDRLKKSRSGRGGSTNEAVSYKRTES